MEKKLYILQVSGTKEELYFLSDAEFLLMMETFTIVNSYGEEFELISCGESLNVFNNEGRLEILNFMKVFQEREIKKNEKNENLLSR